MSIKHHAANSKMAKSKVISNSKMVEGSPAEEATESPAFEAREDAMESPAMKRAEKRFGTK